MGGAFATCKSGCPIITGPFHRILTLQVLIAVNCVSPSCDIKVFVTSFCDHKCWCVGVCLIHKTSSLVLSLWVFCHWVCGRSGFSEYYLEAFLLVKIVFQKKGIGWDINSWQLHACMGWAILNWVIFQKIQSPIRINCGSLFLAVGEENLSKCTWSKWGFKIQVGSTPASPRPPL